MGEDKHWDFVHGQGKLREKKIERATKLLESVYTKDCSSYAKSDIGLKCTARIRIGTISNSIEG